jgi:hypothetical protein
VFKVPTVTPKKYTGNRYRYSRRAEARLLAPTRGQAGLLLVEYNKIAVTVQY